ncbi:McrB family protein [Chitinibacter sp. ZOR0017]|uniref:McrB family protein n=1 Tax=Chitinibacter sp. ZOR0017 TaxID=1339254 RepID=UPI000A61CF25|nr:hypothetical protein [Chitinibacter sp. ZOR0017]
MSFEDFCKQVSALDEQTIAVSNSLAINFSNKNGKVFSVDPVVLVAFINALQEKHEDFLAIWRATPSRGDNFTSYEEKSYREIFKLAGSLEGLTIIASLGGSQTSQLTRVISKLICYYGKFNYQNIKDNTFFDRDSTRIALKNIPNQLTSLTEDKNNRTKKTKPLNFESWLKNNGASDRTIASYTITVPNKFDALTGSNESNSSMLSIRSLSDLDRLSTQVRGLDEWKTANTNGNGMYDAGLNKYKAYLQEILTDSLPLPKPLLLLAGISGTGKTRFVRQQAERTAIPGSSNFELIPVRPDWHEPSDLLGYVSRIDGTRYVATPFLQFMAAAWRDAAMPGAAYQLKDPAEMTPFWACLDEMNLAPVEQYFADYLSVLETRAWCDGHYSSAPIFAPGKLLKSANSAVLDQLCSDLGLAGEVWAGLWDYFIEHGMPLPPNLIVAGTVNMDETTHGFSRKVIDRAFTIDFGEFFPNVYADYFEPKQQPVTLGFPLDSQIANADELGDVAADPDGQRSIEFLQAVNVLLKGTPFELAFRALNELLVMLKCFSPQTDAQLYAVWDDFLMAKLLPRLEGDEDKLQASGDDSLLVKLKTELTTRFASSASRPDLFNIQLADGKSPDIPFRSLGKLGWMQDRLLRDRFTSFWP